MAVEQGIKTQIKRVKQSGLGVAGSGGSDLMRRVTLSLVKEQDTYQSAELVAHQQSTGATHGAARITGALNGEMAAGSYDLEFANLLRKDFAATTALTAQTLTIAGSAPIGWTITRSTGNFLTDGFKVGDIVRLAGANLASENTGNIQVIKVVALVLTCFVVNGTALKPESAKSASTVTVVGKKSWVPSTGHTNDYFTWEKFYQTNSYSDLFVDVKVASADISIPATGISTVNLPLVGLSRKIGTAAVLTSPTAAGTSNVLAAVAGKVVINGVITPVTGIQISVDGATTAGEPEVGSSVLSDLQVGRVSVSGSFTAKFSSQAIQQIFDAQSIVTLIVTMADSISGAAAFVSITLPAIKIFSDTLDDGEKELIRTYDFTAQRFAGAAGVEATILQMQDSLAA